ncbi:sensor histidine kinase [Pseudoscardovia radai]|uniref:sensor histidine kinase n=1 Tax=Pseudoscardovia radai TaxID=987066 RepID=UPI003992A6F5
MVHRRHDASQSRRGASPSGPAPADAASGGSAPHDAALHGSAPTGSTPSGSTPCGTTPLGSTPLSRLVDMASRARTASRRLSTVRLGDVCDVIAVLAVFLFLVLELAVKNTMAVSGIVCMFVGIALGWTQMTLIMNAADAGETRPRPLYVVLAVGSAVITVAGVVLVCRVLMPWAYVVRGLLGGVILVVAIVLIIAPWWLSLVANLGEERARAAREELRADYATHLHDSVLQTLALIQLHADDPDKTRALARGQERDLREWLYGDPGAVLHPDAETGAKSAGSGMDGGDSTGASAAHAGAGGGTDSAAVGTARRRGIVDEATLDALAAPSSPHADPAAQADTLSRAIKRVAAQIEDAQEKPIDVVVVGDRRMTPRLRTMVAAMAEALRNAARHGAPPISVYAEVMDDAMGFADTVDVYVRDHGDGFDVTHLPEGHRGVRDSILERMRRVSGVATIDSRPGWGTEVHLRLRDVVGNSDAAQPDGTAQLDGTAQAEGTAAEDQMTRQDQTQQEEDAR